MCLPCIDNDVIIVNVLSDNYIFLVYDSIDIISLTGKSVAHRASISIENEIQSPLGVASRYVSPARADLQSACPIGRAQAVAELVEAIGVSNRASKRIKNCPVRDKMLVEN
jgi:hypothetical protein